MESFNLPQNNSVFMREADVPILTGVTCQNRLRASVLGNSFTLNQESFICAGGDQIRETCDIAVVSLKHFTFQIEIFRQLIDAYIIVLFYLSRNVER